MGTLIRATETLLSSNGPTAAKKGSYRPRASLRKLDLGEVFGAYQGLVSLMGQRPAQSLEEIRGAVEYLLDAVLRAERTQGSETPRATAEG
jgi:hypothetical protein